MTVYLHSLGCDKNLVDSEIMLGLMYESGYKSAAEPGQADVIVVNTCGFIQEAVEEGINTILELAAHKEDGNCSKLIVTGCMAQRYRKEIEKEIPEVDYILGAKDFPKIVAAITGKDTNEEIDVDVLEDELYAKRANTMPMHVAYVKIAEGCDNCCTYCTIPSIKGRYRSRKIESIVKECNMLVKNGVKELVLVAQDTARYGTDIYDKPRLHDLLEEIAKIDDLEWARLMYAYPEHIYPELIEVMAKHKKICNYIDMPIQHSHDKVIARMGRRSTSDGLKKLISQLKEKDIAVRTTLIAGFPGESAEEFEQMYNFVKEMKFSHLGVFAYSQEDGTKAAAMDCQIEESVKRTRQDALMLLQSEIAEENGKALVGRVLKVMVDGTVGEEDEGMVYTGRSQRDAYEIDGAVFFTSAMEWMSGDTLNVKIIHAKGYDLYGEPTAYFEEENGERK